MLVNDEVHSLKKMRYEKHDTCNIKSNTYGSNIEVQRQQLLMTTIVANKISVAYDRLAFISKQRDFYISDLEQKLHSIGEVFILH